MVVRIQKVIIIKYKRANNGLTLFLRHVRSIERQQPPGSEDGGGGPGEVVVEPHVGFAAPHTRDAVNAVQQRPQVRDGEKVMNPRLANTRHLSWPEHTGHFVQPHVAAYCGGPEHTRATCGGDMYVMYANALSVAGTSHSLSHT